eukprot:10566361-Alexandrium_andersonii.AAC.1
MLACALLGPRRHAGKCLSSMGERGNAEVSLYARAGTCFGNLTARKLHVSECVRTRRRHERGHAEGASARARVCCASERARAR